MTAPRFVYCIDVLRVYNTKYSYTVLLQKRVSMIYSVICDKRKLMSRFNWKEVNIENFQSRHFVSAFFTCITASFFFSLLLVSMDTKTSVSLVLFSFTFYVYYYSFISLCIYIKSVLTNKTGIQRREKKKKKKLILLI